MIRGGWSLASSNDGFDRTTYLPHGFVFDCGCGEVGAVGSVTSEGCDFAHRGDGDDAFGGEVGLVRELAGEVV